MKGIKTTMQFNRNPRAPRSAPGKPVIKLYTSILLPKKGRLKVDVSGQNDQSNSSLNYWPLLYHVPRCSSLSRKYRTCVLMGLHRCHRKEGSWVTFRNRMQKAGHLTFTENHGSSPQPMYQAQSPSMESLTKGSTSREPLLSPIAFASD